MDLSTKTFGKLREHGRTVRRVLAELFERYFTDHVARSSAELAYYMLFMLFRQYGHQRLSSLLAGNHR